MFTIVATGIDRSSPLPFYHQLKQLLIADLSARALSPGDRLPGDFELCATYDVSRTVVRQALSELEAEGLIERHKGRGTFVAQPRTAEGLAQSLTGLYEDVAARGSQLVSEVVRLEVVPADDVVAAELQLEPGDLVIVLERLRFVDDIPWVLTITHVPQAVAPGLVDEDFTHQSLYALLEDKFDVRPVRGRRSIGATVATPALARTLGIEVGAAILELRSISVDAQGRGVETFVAYHRGDRSRFEVELVRSDVPGPALMHVTD